MPGRSTKLGLLKSGNGANIGENSHKILHLRFSTIMLVIQMRKDIQRYSGKDIFQLKVGLLSIDPQR